MKTAPAVELTPSRISRFEAHDFETQPPGTVVQDFDALLSLIGDQGLPVTSAHLFPINRLETFNQNLTHPLVLGLKRPMQKSYPHINGLYLLLRSTAICLIDTQTRKPVIKFDPLVLASWNSLNQAERYFALLKAWLGRASEEIMGEPLSRHTSVLTKLLDFIARLPKRRVLTFATPQDADRLRHNPGLYNLALMELFGWLNIRPTASIEGWLPERIQLTDWGETLLGGYADFIHHSLAGESDVVMAMLAFKKLFDPIDCFDRWSRVVQPHVKGWRNDLEIPDPDFQSGIHVFKVSLGTNCWRRIAIPGDECLEELSTAILSAFGFARDHLYSFSYKDRFGRIMEIDHPFLANESDNRLTDEVDIGDLFLQEGMRIKFLFDFGDQWRFDLQTESVNAESLIPEIKVLEKQGKAPKQYGPW